MKHKKAARRHFISRVKERYGRSFGQGDVIRIKKILDKKEGRSVQTIHHNGTELTVVYDRTLKELVTALPNPTHEVMNLLAPGYRYFKDTHE